MADRKMTVLNPAGYQEILQTTDELIVDSNSVEFKSGTEIGFFDATPQSQYVASDQSLSQVIEQIRTALNAFGLTNITGNSNYLQDLSDLQDYINNPISISGTTPIQVEETNNAYSISVDDATASSKGVVQVGNSLSVDSGVISADIAATGSTGVISVGSGLAVTAEGVLSVKTAANDEAGIIEIATLEEIITGTDNTKAISPSGLSGALNEKNTDVGDAADDGFTIDCGVYDS